MNKINNINNKNIDSYLPMNSPFPFKIPFPPPIDESELQPSMKKGKLSVRATNQFLLYRTAVIKTLRENGVQDINMRQISKMASDLWQLEPEFVQQEYKSLALKAKGLHQKTAKYLTSCHLKENIAQRPLAPMPESSNSAENLVTSEKENETKEIKLDTNYINYIPPENNFNNFNQFVQNPYMLYSNLPINYDSITPQDYSSYYIQAGPEDNLPIIYPTNEYFDYFE
ncbi:hypothetical protein C1645_307290 [Glomus cerebriforme]|uniref:HMG box domain-containing protein n=1 Tax=Glomus cerebriforme TaxID=658196 RepID=A0A397TIG9_9GLOM|nr:hypothetical protein C1645_307290 [Glomus cerebriforme]